MLHRLDDYPVHPTSEPLLHTMESPNAYDRFFFNGWTPDGDLFFAVAFGVYPNRQVMDGAFSVVRDGVQHNVRGSRTCPTDRAATSVEPITVTIEEPMRRHRVEVAGEHGLAADLEFVALSPAIEEPRFVHRRGARTLFDYTRLTQFGRWSGSIDLDVGQHDLIASRGGAADPSAVAPLGPPRPSHGPHSGALSCSVGRAHRHGVVEQLVIGPHEPSGLT